MLSVLSAINTEALVKGANILWQGLLAIFVVVGIVILATKLLTFVFFEEKKKDEDDEETR